MTHSRRDVLKIASTVGAAVGTGAAATGGTAAVTAAAAASAATAADASANGNGIAAAQVVAGVDLAKIPVVDSHLHPYKRTLISAQYRGQRDTFTAAVLPPGDYPDKDAVRARLLKGYEDLVWGVSRRTGYFNYVSRTYGVAPTLDGFDSVLKPHITSDAAFVAYVRAMLDRANIVTLVVQSAEPEPVAPQYLAPAGRTVWTWPVSQMAEPEWARQHGLTELSDVLAAVRKTMETAVSNGCRGFKNLSAYYREFGLAPVTAQQAQSALRAMAKVEPTERREMGALYYADPAIREQVRSYQDYLFKQIYITAGKVERPMIIHSAAILHPALAIRNNDPLPLYDVFMDPDIVRAGTNFVLIHGGFPNQGEVASFISQLPHVYVDVSHLAKYPAVLEDTYRALLQAGPAYKVMHGSDSGGVPDETGYCAWSSRQALARILTEYKTYYAWRPSDIESIARGVLHDNAARFYRI